MAPRNQLVEAAAQLGASEQGHLDSLCGLYSILNAIKLATWPSVKQHAQQSNRLFKVGVAHLDDAGLTRDVLQSGMDEDTWVWLCELLTAEAVSISGIPLRRVPVDVHP